MESQGRTGTFCGHPPGDKELSAGNLPGRQRASTILLPGDNPTAHILGLSSV
jgi:hypothetical protein